MKRALVLALATSVLAGAALLGCGGGTGTCGSGETGGIFLTVTGSDVEANGTDFFRVTISAKDENCQRLPAGSEIQLNLRDPEPAGVGYFGTNNDDTLLVTLTELGATTQVKSSVPGSVVLSAFAPAFPTLASLPRELEFLEPQTTGQCGVEVRSESPSILADGASSTLITALLTGDDGAPMPNNTSVTFTTTLGTFTGSGNNSFTTTAAGGQATATLKSEVLTAAGEATVTASFTCNDPARTSESNTVQVRFVLEMDRPVVVLSSNKSTVLADDASTVALTAEVFAAGGARVGAGEEVDFATNLGSFTENGLPAYTALTDADGKAYATFKGGSLGGLATISAAIYLEGQNANDQVQVNVRQVGFVEFDEASTLKLGVRGSGVLETSQVSFVIKDTTNEPFQGVLVNFTKSLAPGVTLDPLSVLTDAEGRATTTLKSGTQATSVTVTATAVVGNVEIDAVSPAFAIVGAKPSQGAITFVCEEYNVGGFSLANVQTDCSVYLADRYQNKIGFETQVNFTTEAGQITSNALTLDSGENMGSAVTTIRTGNPVPQNVVPFPAEPRVGAGPLYNNPRDGLLTIMAYTTGEEEFDDRNANGLYDPGEPFVDISEPLLDKDDDGLFGPGDSFIDANDNGQFDGPNGQWDGNTLIWTHTWMVWTGGPEGGVGYGSCGANPQGTYMCPNLAYTYPDLGWGFYWVCPTMGRVFNFGVSDANLNPVNRSLRLSATVGQRLTLQSTSPAMPYSAPDSLGTYISYTKHVAPDAASPECTPNDLVCYQMLSVGWHASLQLTGQIVVAGPSVSQPEPVVTNVLLDIDYRESPNDGANRSLGLGLPGYAGVYGGDVNACQ